MWWISGWSSGREGGDTEARVRGAGAIFPGGEIGEVAWRRWHQSGLKSERGSVWEMERHIQWGGTAQASSGKWEIKGVYLSYEETANASCVARDQR